MIITEMDNGEEILFAVVWTYVYPVGIQIVDNVKHLCDKWGYLGKLFLFECYSLLVLINEAFGKNVFFLMILSVICVLLKNVFKKSAKIHFILFLPFTYGYLFSLYILF